MLALFGATYALLVVSPQSHYYADMFRTISVEAFPLMALAYACMALLYVWQIVRLVSNSIRLRQLCLNLGPSTVAIHPEQSSNTLPESRIASLTHSLRQLYRLFFNSRGILGVRGRFFDTVMLLREVVEIAVQVAQAYSCRGSTPDIGTNLTFGALLVLNCLAAPLLHHYSHASSSGVHRLSVLVVDLVLDVVWSVMLPFSFLAPYAAHIGSQEGVIYHDTFIAKALMEAPMIAVTSPGDLFMKLIPTTSLFFTLRKFELLIQRKSNAVAALPDRQALLLKRQLSSFSAMLVTSSGVLGQLQAAVRRSSDRISSDKTRSLLRAVSFRRSTCVQTLLLWMMLATGTVVLVANILAISVYDPHCPDGCKLHVSPWFVVDSSRCECAVQEINCYDRRIDGSASELHDVLLSVDANKLLALIITHCHALEIPQALHRFHNLFSLEIFNSSIRAWPSEAAITQHALPRFWYLLLVYTFLSALPEGVYHASLPASLREVDIVVSNLTTLPDDLHDKWPYVRALYVDLAQLTEFPPSLQKMTQLETISLRGNRIQNVPVDALEPLQLRFLMLSENPLTTLPATTLSTLTQLQIVGTQIAALESSDSTSPTAPRATKTIYARESAVRGCSARGARGLARRCVRAYTTYNGVPSVGYYPLQGKLAERRPKG